MEIVGPPPWISSVHSLLTDLRAQSESSTSIRSWYSIYRVPPHIRELRANCYDFVVLPLGPYNTDFRAKTPIVELKLEVLIVVLSHLNIDWNAFCSRIANLEKLESPLASPSSRLSEYFNATDMAPDEEREVDPSPPSRLSGASSPEHSLGCCCWFCICCYRRYPASEYFSATDMAPDEEREVDTRADSIQHTGAADMALVESGEENTEYFSGTDMAPDEGREVDTRVAADHSGVADMAPDEEREVDPGAEADDTSATGTTPNRELDTRAAEDHTSAIALASAEDSDTSSTIRALATTEDPIQRYHNPPIDFLTSEEVRAALVMDAVFVAAVFLQAYAQPEKWPLTDALWKIFSRGTVQYHVAPFKRDIFLPFENQIPLSMVKNAWEEIYTLVGEKPFDFSLELNIFKFLRDSGLPFPESEEGFMTFHGCDHLLACLHKVICTHVPVHPPTTSKIDHVESFISWLLSALCSVICFLPGKAIYVFSMCLRNTPIVRHLVKSTKRKQSFCDIVGHLLKFAKSQPGASVDNECLRRRTLPTVAELRKAGVHFKGVQTGIGGFRFEKSFFNHRATLYLPRIDFNDSTQKFLLNLCAYEGMNIRLKKKKLFAYMTIMDDLISSEEDVQLLRKGDEPVITENYLGEDKKIAELFNDTLPDFNANLSDFIDFDSVTNQIHDWYKAGWRIRLTRFLDRFDHTPWAVITLLVAAILLVAAMVQVYFAVERHFQK
ncbi:hypothetical protein R1flu_023191 [Riccia fluitans]|uniref:Uncharacterized protein n=1 Tax=Riccia fluitans TaxID=41844 RepID=A0ABD1XRB2_9MARC